MVRRGERTDITAIVLCVLLSLCAAQAESGGLAETSGAERADVTGRTDVTERADVTDRAGVTERADFTEHNVRDNEGSTDLAPSAVWRCPLWCFCDEGLEWMAECTRAELAYEAQWQPGEYVKLTCRAPPARRLLPEDLPTLLTEQFVESSGFYSCEVKAGRGAWAAALRAQGVTNTTRLTLQNATTDTLTADALQGLEALELLTIRYPTGDEPWTPPRDLLAATPALRRFTVRGAAVRLEVGGLAAAPPTLHTLELAEGRVELVAGAFRGLAHVRRLLLWSAGLEALPAGALDGLDALEELELTGNALTALEAGALGGAPRLHVLHVAGNPVRSVAAGALPPGLAVLELWRCAGSAPLALGSALSGLAALRTVRLDYCRLEALSPRLLAGASSLQNLTLTGAGLEALPLGLFADTRALQRLDLSYNRLDHLPAGIFTNLISLKELNLDWNRIQTLSEGSLFGLSALSVLSLRSCGLESLRVSALSSLSALTHLRLDNNSLTLDEDTAPDDTLGPHSALRGLRSLVSLQLAHNYVSRVYADWRLALRLERLDLAHNRLADLTDADLNFLSTNIVVDLRHNNISTIMLVNLPPSVLEAGSAGSAGGAGGATILLDDNPYACDCRLEGLVRRVRAGGAGLRARAAHCASPATLLGRALADVEPRALTCHVPAPPCPSACRCDARPAAAALELACDVTPSTLPAPRALGLQHSSLRVLSAPPPHSALALPDHVARLDLSALNLTAVPALSLSSGATLDLRYNALTAVPETLLRAANLSRFTVLLAGNPIRCPCEAQILKLVNKTVADWSVSQCVPGACAGLGGAGAVLGAVLALCVAAAAGAAALYMRYRRPVRAFLVARGLWAGAGGVDADDKAQFDAFVSYSHEDDEWVSEMARALESRGVRLCLHARDWVPGDLIPAQIARSVEAARRTLLVVSPAWAASRWARAEWQAAHARECSEGRARVLVVLRASCPPAGLPASLRAHVAARTYLPHDDPQLVDKLRAALAAPLERARPPPRVLPAPPRAPLVLPAPPPLLPDKLDVRY